VSIGIKVIVLACKLTHEKVHVGYMITNRVLVVFIISALLTGLLLFYSAHTLQTQRWRNYSSHQIMRVKVQNETALKCLENAVKVALQEADW
jgi:hypothetical protein